MKAHQEELCYEPSTNDVDRAMEKIRLILEHSGEQWVRGKDLMVAMGMTERQIRRIAEESNGLIISAPGTPGYALAESPSDIEKLSLAIDLRIKQIKTEAKRVIQLRRRMRELQIPILT